jgi:hypothetical protein
VGNRWGAAATKVQGVPVYCTHDIHSYRGGGGAEVRRAACIAQVQPVPLKQQTGCVTCRNNYAKRQWVKSQNKARFSPEGAEVAPVGPHHRPSSANPLLEHHPQRPAHQSWRQLHQRQWVAAAGMPGVHDFFHPRPLLQHIAAQQVVDAGTGRGVQQGQGW